MLPTPPPLATAPDARPPSLSAVARTGGDTGRHPAPPPPPRVKPASTTRRGAPKATSALAVVRTTRASQLGVLLWARLPEHWVFGGPSRGEGSSAGGGGGGGPPPRGGEGGAEGGQSPPREG